MPRTKPRTEGCFAVAPRHLTQLQARIRNRSRALGRGEGVLERLIANVVVGQMLPPGMMKGGTALKVRIGDTRTRFSRDLDATRMAWLHVDLWDPWCGGTGNSWMAQVLRRPLELKLSVEGHIRHRKEQL